MIPVGKILLPRLLEGDPILNDFAGVHENRDWDDYKSSVLVSTTVNNGGFENGTTGWIFFGNADVVGINSSPNPPWAHSGSFGGRIGNHAGSAASGYIESGTFQTQYENSALHFDFWFKHFDTTAQSFFKVYESGILKDTVQLPKDNSYWNRFRYTYNVVGGSGTNVKFRFELVYNGSTESATFLDDVKVVEHGYRIATKSGSTPVSLNNWNFESSLSGWVNYNGATVGTKVTWASGGFARLSPTPDYVTNSLWQNIGNVFGGKIYQVTVKASYKFPSERKQTDSEFSQNLNIAVRYGNASSPAASSLLKSGYIVVNSDVPTERVFLFQSSTDLSDVWIGFWNPVTSGYVDILIQEVGIKFYGGNEGLSLMDRFYSRIWGSINILNSLSDYSTAPPQFLDFLLYKYAIPSYIEFSDTTKRNILKNAWEINKKRYTVEGLNLLFTSMSSSIDAVHTTTKVKKFLSLRFPQVGFSGEEERNTLGNTIDNVSYVLSRSPKKQYIDFLMNNSITKGFKEFVRSYVNFEVPNLDSGTTYSTRFLAKSNVPVTVSVNSTPVTVDNGSFTTDLSGWFNYTGGTVGSRVVQFTAVNPTTSEEIAKVARFYVTNDTSSNCLTQLITPADAGQGTYSFLKGVLYNIKFKVMPWNVSPILIGSLFKIHVELRHGGASASAGTLIDGADFSIGTDELFPREVTWKFIPEQNYDNVWLVFRQGFSIGNLSSNNLVSNGEFSQYSTEGSLIIPSWSIEGDITLNTDFGYLDKTSVSLGRSTNTQGSGSLFTILRLSPETGRKYKIEFQRITRSGNPLVYLEIYELTSSGENRVVRTSVSNQSVWTKFSYTYTAGSTNQLKVRIVLDDDTKSGGIMAIDKISATEVFDNSSEDSFLLDDVSIYYYTDHGKSIVTTTSNTSWFKDFTIDSFDGSQTNILDNGDFEQYNGNPDSGVNTAIPNWTTDIVNNPSGYVESTKNFVNSGHVAAKLFRASGGDSTTKVTIYQDFSVGSEVVYGVRVWYRGDGRFYFVDNSGKYFNFSSGGWDSSQSSNTFFTFSSTSTWSQKSLTFKPLPDASSVRVVLESRGALVGDSATAYFDSVTVLQNPDLGSIGLPTNPKKSYEVFYVKNDKTLVLKEDYGINGFYSWYYNPNFTDFLSFV
jgi:hypothetical protein